MSVSFGERIFKWIDDHFVGREFEQAVFRQWLEQLDAREERILNVYGTAGMGKTYLLNRFAGIARACGAMFASADARDALGRKERLLAGWLESMGVPADGDEAGLSELCLRTLNERSATRRLVLALDGYEEIGSLDHWLRASFLPRLGGNLLVVVSGRFPLEGPWRHEPAWKRLIVRLPLTELSYGDIRAYLRKWGFADERTADRVWLRTMGHPLALSLLTPAGGEAAADAGETDPLQGLLDAWLREAPDDGLRELLFAASAVRTFHQDLLAKLLERDVSSTLFQQLTGLSFVSRTARGWQLHELVWETLRRHGRERMPETFETYRRRAIRHYVGKLEEGLERGTDVGWEFAELLRHADNPVLRAHYRHARVSRHYTEPLQPANYPEAAAYVRRRRERQSASKVLCSDPETGASYRFELPPELTGARLELVPLERLAALGEDAVRLLRDPDGRVAGLFAIVPVNGSTWDFLAESPVSRAYIASLADDERRRLRSLPPGEANTRFVYALDVESLEPEELRSELVGALLEPMLAGCRLVESPPPHPYYRLGKTSLGFRPLEGAEHADYGGDAAAPTYVLDTRRQTLRTLLDRLVAPDGEPAAERPAPREEAGVYAGLTPREREVAERLTLGWTNADIAAALFVSEAAVKKHVNAMLSKFGLRNRTQLAHLFMNPHKTESMEERESWN